MTYKLHIRDMVECPACSGNGCNACSGSGEVEEGSPVDRAFYDEDDDE
jgi:hypothetical protein